MLQDIFERCSIHCLSLSDFFLSYPPTLQGLDVINTKVDKAEAMDKVAAIEAVCAAHDVRLVDAAFRFPLMHPSVISVIPGGQSPAEMASNLRAAQAQIPPALWSDLKSAGVMRQDAPTA